MKLVIGAHYYTTNGLLVVVDSLSTTWPGYACCHTPDVADGATHAPVSDLRPADMFALMEMEVE